MDIHVGKMIEKVAREKRLTTREIMEALGTGERNISYVFSRQGISLEKLWRISVNMNHNFFADIQPIVAADSQALRWEEIAKLYKTERTKKINIEIEFPVSLSNDIGRFIMLAGELGLRMGFKVG